MTAARSTPGREEVRRLAAELEHDALHALRRLPHHLLADLERAGEADLGDRGSEGQRHRLVATGDHDVEDAGRHAGLLGRVGDQQRGQGSQGRGQQHHGAACGQCRPDLRDREQERVVVGAQRRHRSDRAVADDALAPGGGRVDAERLGAVGARPVGVPPQVAQRGVDLEGPAQGDRGPGLRDDGGGQQVPACLERVRQAVQDRRALRRLQRRPGAERRRGGVGRREHLRVRGHRQPGQHLPGRRVVDGQLRALAGGSVGRRRAGRSSASAAGFASGLR
ncbi:hypothetical protein [Nocardioides sp. TF02-7]|uniref:hypothetical protein n=1 Tax=Nocardioides sp. TF02-7 TaxID=2917724 RepID=UPI0023DC85A9|nr:hypothetical protein [Nocardioides sp. TF02-7]